MGTLDRYQAMSHRARIYVPATLDGNVAAPTEVIAAQTESVIKQMSRLFGGATSFDARGGWVDSSGAVVTEGIRIIESRASELPTSAIDSIVSIAQAVKATMRQESIAIEIDSAMYLI